ncbi:MAG: hypothetical protein QM755_06340 [Luteolibacter sp.]
MTVALVTQAGSQNLVVNGEFQDGAATPPNEFATSSTVPGWTITPMNIDFGSYVMASGETAVPYGYPNYTLLPGANFTRPDNGQYFLMDSGLEYGILSQQITGLVVGQTYLLTFDQSLMHLTAELGDPESTYVQVTMSDGVNTFTQNSATMSDDGTHSVDWMTQTMTFTATAATQTLSFTGIGTGGPPQLGLDSISLVAIPEPGAALLCSLLGVLSLFKRKRS